MERGGEISSDCPGGREYFQRTLLLQRLKSSRAFCGSRTLDGILAFIPPTIYCAFKMDPTLQPLHSYQASQGLGKVRAGSAFTLFGGADGEWLSVLRERKFRDTCGNNG